jgi:hypothetical protein
LIDGVATAGAVAALKTAGRTVFRSVLGDKQWRAVQQVLEDSLTDTLQEFEEQLDPDVADVLESLFVSYFADKDVVEVLLIAAFTQERPDEDRLRERFGDLDLDEDTLPVDLSTFIAAFSVALQERARAKVLEHDSGLAEFATQVKLDRILERVSPPTRVPLGVEARRYADWLSRVTATFEVPGLGVPLPVDEAWVRLRARPSPGWEDGAPDSLAKWLERDREWATLAERWSAADRSLDAEQVLHVGRLTVVVGGPGAGKSTLQKRLAHRLAEAGETAMLVRLPDVLRAMGREGGFADALVKVAADGSWMDETTAGRVLSEPAYLLADGLDECDPERQRVAAALNRWAEGHPGTSVVVTTRSVGHYPALLPGWGYAELLPLARSDVREHAKRLLVRLPSQEGKDIERVLDSFERTLETNRAASLAARNPLLLGFLVWLFVSGVGFGGSRAELYRRIIEQILERPPADRETTAEVDATLGRLALEATGWILQRNPELSEAELIERLGDELATELDYTPLRGRQVAGRCLRFWEERRVLERLTFGSEAAVRFVHLSLGEYAAAMFASRLGDEDLRAWVRDVRRKSRWRETLLLAASAAEEVIDMLLEMDDLGDPAAEETELALAALSEMQGPSPGLIREAVERLRERLVSDIPLVAFEAAEAALKLAAQAPDIIGPIVLPLTEHNQEWTRLSAVRLSLACGEGWEDLDAFESFVDDTTGHKPREAIAEDWGLGQRRGMFAWSFEDEMLMEGIERLLEVRPSRDTRRRIEQVYLGNHVSMGAHDDMTLLLVRHGGYQHVIQKSRGRQGYADADMKRQLRGEQRRAEKDFAFLEAVLCATGAVQDVNLPEPAGELIALSKLVYGMGWPQTPVTQADIMRHRIDLDAVDAIFRGAIAAMELDPHRLAAEAALAKKRFEEDPARIDGRLLSQVVDLPVEPRWDLAADANLPSADLVRALKHPSAPIVENAVNLIEHGAGGAEVPELLKEVAGSPTEHASRAVAYLAPKVWGEDAVEVLLEVFDDCAVTRQNYGLLLILPYLPGASEDERVRRVLLRGLWAEDPEAASGVAEKLVESEVFDLDALAPELEMALEHWTERGSWCDKHRVAAHGSSCPKCSTVPDSPRAHLVRALAGTGRLGIERLVELSEDPRHDVRDAAAEALASSASDSRTMLEDLLGRVRRGELGVPVLTRILSLHLGRLREAKTALVDLLDAPSARVREEILEAMVGLRWIERDEAVALSVRSLSDHAPAVRDQAVKTLRAARTPSVDRYAG